MRDMVGASTDAPVVPGIDEVEDQRRMNTYGGLKAGGGLPGPVADTCNMFPDRAGRMQGKGASVAGDDMTRVGETVDFHLKPLKRTIHISDSGTAGRFLSKHMPWFECKADLQIHPPLGDLPDFRELEFEVRCEPRRINGIPVLREIPHDILKILPDKVWQEKTVMKFRAPSREFCGRIGILPKPGYGTSQQEMLGKTHFGMRRHLKMQAAYRSRKS